MDVVEGQKVNPIEEKEKVKWMSMAIDQAKVAASMGEVPIGCVIVHQGKVIGYGHNRREMDRQASAHAEMIAIRQANEYLDNWRLEDCQLFVTLEPCSMCAGAIVLARIPELYVGASDPKSGMAGSILNLVQREELNHRCQLETGLLAEECSQLLKDFFKDLRQKRKKAKR